MEPRQPEKLSSSTVDQATEVAPIREKDVRLATWVCFFAWTVAVYWITLSA